MGDITQASGWWPQLIHARCHCGWKGPTRDLYTHTGKVLAHLDAQDHERTCRQREADRG